MTKRTKKLARQARKKAVTGKGSHARATKTVAPNLTTARALIVEKMRNWYDLEKTLCIRVSNMLTDVSIGRDWQTGETQAEFMFVGFGVICVVLDGMHNLSTALSSIDELVWALLIAEAKAAVS